MITIKSFFKKLTILGWFTAGLFGLGALVALIGLILVLATPIPEAGLVVLVVGFCMLLLTIPFFFACSVQCSLLKLAEEAAEEREEEEAAQTVPVPPMPAPIPQPEPIPMPPPAVPIPTPQATVAMPAVRTQPAPQPMPAPEATMAIPAVKPQPAPKPKIGYVYLLDELGMKEKPTMTRTELKDANGMTLVFARDKGAFGIQMVRALAGNIETERLTLPADYFQTNGKNDFRIWLFKQSIFRVDVDLLWEDAEFRAIAGL